MRLISHNLLKCNAAGVKVGYPLKIVVVTAAKNVGEVAAAAAGEEEEKKSESKNEPLFRVVPLEFKIEMVRSLVKRIELETLKSAASDLQIPHDFLDRVSVINIGSNDEEEVIWLKQLHHLLLEVHVDNGFLVCPESGRKFPLVDGIPNMLLHEDEV